MRGARVGEERVIPIVCERRAGEQQQSSVRKERVSGRVVQLVRMPACHAGGRRFEPVPGRHMVGVVKWLRPRVVAPVFVGSNPTIHPTFFFNNNHIRDTISPR